MSKNNGIEAGVRNSEEYIVRPSEYVEILDKMRIMEDVLMKRREEMKHNRTSVEIREKLLNQYLESGKSLADTGKERDHFLLNPEFLAHYRKNVVYLKEKIRVEEFKIGELMNKRDARLSEFRAAAHSEISRSVSNQVKDVQPDEPIPSKEEPKPLKPDQHQQSCL